MSYGRLLLVLSLVALAAASLPGKLMLAPSAAGSGQAGAAERLAADRLATSGWVAAGVVNLTENGLFRLLAFRSPRCQGMLLLSAVAANGESETMLAQIARPHGTLFYVDGAGLTEPPRLRAYLLGKLAPLLHRLGLVADPHAHEVLAVIVTGDCRHSADLPWAPVLTDAAAGD